MGNFTGIVYLTDSQYLELKTNGTLTVDNITINFDENTLYVTDDNTQERLTIIETDLSNAQPSINFAESERQKSLNLLPIKQSTSIVERGLTFTFAEDGTVNISGTTDSAGSVNIAQFMPKFEAGKTYTFSMQDYSGANPGNWDISIGTSMGYWGVEPDKSSSSKTFSTNETATSVVFYSNGSGIPFNNTFKLMLNEGSTSIPFTKFYGEIVHEKQIADVEHIETLYDMASYDSNLNWGYTSGINAGIEITGKDFSKYKYLKFYCNTMMFNVSCVNGQMRGGSATIFDNNYIYFFTVRINETLTGFSSVFGLKDNNNQFVIQSGTEIIQKIEGVY
jgi:hypothetical protein